MMQRKVLIYPLVILCILIITFMIIFTYIMPTFISMYEGLNINLPILTKILRYVAEALKNPMVISLIILILLVTSSFCRSQKFSLIDFISLYLPFYSRIVKFREYSAFSSFLGILLKGNVPLNEAVKLAVLTIKNSFFKEKVQNKLKEEYTNLSTMLKETNLFDKSFVWIISLGEKTETLDEVLLEAGKIYSEEVWLLTKRFLGYLIPSYILIVGLCVTTVILGELLPIVEIMSALNNYMLP